MSLFDRVTKFLNRNIDPPRNYLCDFNRAKCELQPADIILIEGRSRISRVIRRITHSTWTHSALFIGCLDDYEGTTIHSLLKEHFKGSEQEPLLIESIAGKGTILTQLSEYKNEHVRICRPNGLRYGDVKKVIEYAAEHLGYNYDVRHILDLWRFYLRSIFIPRRWQSKLFYTNPQKADKEICSLLIGNAFKHIKFPILPLIQTNDKNTTVFVEHHTRMLVPSDFDHSPYFNIIKYPIVPDDEKANYKHFPWSEDLVSLGDGTVTEKTPPDQTTIENNDA
jgi:hypothetical protein